MASATIKLFLIHGDPKRLRTVRDHEFTSPSAAAAVVHGEDMNGLTAWKSSDGRLLKDLEAVV